MIVDIKTLAYWKFMLAGQETVPGPRALQSDIVPVIFRDLVNRHLSLNMQCSYFFKNSHSFRLNFELI